MPAPAPAALDRAVFYRLLRCLVAVALSSLAGGGGALADDLLATSRQTFAELPPVAPEQRSHPLVVLGQALFWDPRISANGRVSCASCHLADEGGADRRPFSIDAREKPTSRNSQTVFNALLQPSLRWTGDRTNGAHQAERSLTGSMGFPDGAAAVASLRAAGYETGFREAFPADAEPLSTRRFGEALQAYQSTLITPAPFDRYLNGDTNSLTAVQVRGLRTFLEVGCAECHDGALLGGTRLRKFGIFHEYWGATGSARPDEGLALTTRQETDRYRFRVAMLRNIALTAPYFHDGSVDRLERAVQIMAQVQLGRTLTDTDTASIVEFLRSLTGGVPENYRPPVPAPPAP